MSKFLPFVFLIAIISLLVFGLYDVLTQYESNKCQMTYMFEQPQYIKLELPNEIQDHFPYNLYVYGEGTHAETLRKGIYNGLPILFLPGNSGSYKQARSIGSVLMRMAENIASENYFDVFSVDFDEELSALYGEYLIQQTDYAIECLKYIQSLYRKPTFIILIGHSMGGVIAKAIISNDKIDKNMFRIVIIEASPIRMPVLNIDYSIANFYKDIEDQHFENITIVSTNGGYRDYLVKESYTILPEVENFFSTSTQSIPRAWVSTDHLCHVWCKEIVLVTARTLYDLIDKKQNQITSNVMTRRKILNHHFFSNFGQRFFQTPIIEKEFKFENYTLLKENKYFYFSQNHVKEPFYISFAHNGKDVVVISNIDSVKWISNCNMTTDSNSCKTLINLSPKAIMIPPSENDFLKVIHLGREDLLDSTHLVLFVQQSRKPIQINVEFSPKTIIEHEVPSVFTSLFQFLKFENPERSIINQRLKNELFIKIILLDFASLLQAYDVHIKAYNCRTSGDISVKYVVPWTHAPQYATFKSNGDVNIMLKLPLARPTIFEGWPQLQFYAMQDCQYEVTAIFGWSSVMGQFVRFFGLMLPAYIVIQFFMVFMKQCMDYDSTLIFPNFSDSHFRWAQPYRIVPVAMIINYFLNYIPSNIVLSDLEILKRENIWVNMLPLMLYFSAFALISIFCYLLQGLLYVAAKTLGPIIKRLGGVLKFFDRIIIFGSGISLFICGSVSILITYVLCFLMSIGYLVKINYSSSEEMIKKLRSSYNFSIFLFFITYIQFIFNLPSLLAFFKNPIWFMYIKDLSKYHAAITFFSFVILRWTNFPCNIFDKTTLKLMPIMSYILCIILILFCTLSLYRIPLVIDTLLVLLTISAIVCNLGKKPKSKLEEKAKSE